MKNKILSLTIFASTILSAQIYTPNGATLSTPSGNTNVGIGIANPEAKFHVYQPGSSNYIDAFTIDVESFSNTQNAQASHFFRVRDVGASGNIPFIIKGDGNVGIGTSTPQTRLHIEGDINSTGWSYPPNTTRRIGFITTDNTNGIANYGMSLLEAYPTGTSNDGRGVTLSGYFGLSFFTSSNERIRIDGNGNVGIGTTTPQYKLDVNGKASFSDNVKIDAKLESKEIKVTLTPTADFVFEEDYALPKLEEIEKHIKEKKHLPEIASAKEMEKDGVNVGEFQIKLLQKIEELTLYIIEQNKLIKEQQKRIEALETKK
ncbi:hypothetical protein [Chryseobacterium taiwanense]|uniref:hypothetical protein n=1 Tax=Chryseobacterium taiwanense TaxID=363331 RepID=UPI00068DA4F4|nr:hypothetical protein [Chryseobacterium taiwanense]